MQAIITKVLPATAYKPTRIQAKCSRGHHTVCTNTCNERDHRDAVFALLQKFHKEDKETDTVWHWPFITGQLPNEDYVHILVNPREYSPIK